MARAQGWSPDRPLRLIIPFAAGGSTDVTARLVAQALGERLGQPVVAENRPGAGGNIGAEAAARAAPDGYTLFMAVSGILAANRALYETCPTTRCSDFAPISQVAIIPNLIVVNPDLPVRDLAGLIAYAKAKSGPGAFYGSAGSGTSLHLAAALFAARAGIEMVHVPYRGGAPAATDLMAGKIQLIASPMVEVIGAVRAGQLRPLAVTTPKRSRAAARCADGRRDAAGLRDPALERHRRPGRHAAAGHRRLPPSSTPRCAATTLKRRLAEQGSEPMPSSPEEFAQLHSRRDPALGGDRPRLRRHRRLSSFDRVIHVLRPRRPQTTTLWYLIA